MKKIILLFSLLIMGLAVNAQNVPCDDALAFRNSTSCLNDQILSGEMQWYKFVAGETDETIELKNLNTSSAHIHRMEFYTGSCVGNTLLLTDSIEVNPSNDTLLIIYKSGLTIGDTYYIKVLKTKPGCPKCNAVANYDLCLGPVAGYLGITATTSPVPTFSGFCSGPDPCTLITICVGSSINLSASAPMFVGTTLNWDVIDGSTGWNVGGVPTGSSPPLTVGYTDILNCAFLAVGTYNVHCIATDAWGSLLASGTYTIEVIPNYLSASFTYIPNPACFSDPTGICYTNTSPLPGVGPPITVIWNYGDGITETTCMTPPVCPLTVCHVYSSPGTYILTLTLDNGYCQDVETQTVVVTNTVPLFSWTDVCPGEPTVFTDGSACEDLAGPWLWDFGDGTTSTLQNPSHIFPGVGSYNVILTVTDPINGPVSVNNVVTISNAILPVVNPASLIACDANPTTIAITNFDPANTYTTSILPIGAGTVTAVNPSGQFTVTWNPSFPSGVVVLDVTDVRGCTNSLEIEVKQCCPAQPPSMAFNNADVSDMLAIPGYTTSVGSVTIVTGQTLVINGIFNVTQDLRFDFCTITLGQDAKIIVDPTFTFGAIKSRFSACNFMWDGIYASNITSLILMRDCLVEQAKNAVVVENGARHVLKGNLFNRNYESVVVKNYSGAYPVNSVQSNVFTCRDYTGVPYLTIFPYTINYASYPTTTMNAPFAGQRSKTGFIISFLTYAPSHYQTSDNIFDNLNTGVYCSKSNLKLYNNTFRNIFTTSSGTAIAAVNAIGRTGTFIPFSGPNFNLTVGGTGILQPNTFAGCIVGVNTVLNLNVNIIKNNFSFIPNYAVHCENSSFFNGINITQNDMVNVGVGVFCKGNLICNTQIAENKIKITLPGFFPASTGVWLQELSSAGTGADYTVYNNKIQNVKYGVRASGLNNAIIDNNNIDIRPVTNARGIEVLGNSFTQIVNNEIQCIPGTGITNRGGIYASLSPNSSITCNKIQSIGYSIQCAGPMTSTRVFNNEMTNCTRGVWLSNGGIIGIQGTSTSPSYNKWIGSFSQHTQTTGPATTFGPLSKFFVRSGGPAHYIPSVNIGETSSSSTAITLGPAAGSITSPACSFVPPPAMLLGQQIAQDQIVFSNQEIRWLSKHSLYNELLNDSTLLADPIFDNFKDSIELTSMGKLHRVKKALAKADLSPAELIAAAIENASVFPSSQIETESKTINEILLNNLQAGQDFLDASQLTTLRIIANECPFEYGDAVYSARVLLQAYDSIGTEYSEPCEEDRSMISASEVNVREQGFVLYPNPNKGIMTLAYQLNDSDNGELSIYDLAGRKLKTYPLNTRNTTLTIEENDLSNGIYLYQVIINDKKVKTDRVVIIK